MLCWPSFLLDGDDSPSAFQAAPTKTISAENSIHTINPIAAASPP